MTPGWQVYLSLRHQFHRIQFDEDSKDITVKIYRRKNSAGIKPKPYSYMLWSDECEQYMRHNITINCPAHYRDDGKGYKWNMLDQLLPMHTIPTIDGDDELNFNQVPHLDQLSRA